MPFVQNLRDGTMQAFEQYTGSLQNYHPPACPLKEVADDNYECSLPGLMYYVYRVERLSDIGSSLSPSILSAHEKHHTSSRLLK